MSLNLKCPQKPNTKKDFGTFSSFLSPSFFSILLLNLEMVTDRTLIYLACTLHFNHLVSVTDGEPESPRGHMQPSSTVDFSWFVAFWEYQNFPCWNLMKLCVILWVYYTTPFGFSLFWHFCNITFQLFKLLCLAKDHWWGLSTRNAHMVHIFN